MENLEGKIALVTGGSSGIGLASARAMAKAGAKVALAARSADKLAQAADEMGNGAAAITADLTAPGGVETAVRETENQIGPIDIVMANAGLYLAGDVAETDPDAMDRVLNTNVNSVFRLIRTILPGMIERGQGDILATSSIAGHQAIHWEPVYSASKHALQSFMHGLRRQVGDHDIRALAVAPGLVLNDLWNINDPEEIDRKAKAGEGLRSEDVAEAVVFMLTRPRNVAIRDLVMLPRRQPL